jgi:hypothetical protein
MKGTVLSLACACVVFPAQAQQQQPQTPPAGFILKQIGHSAQG